jgi:hypothetical protein
VSGPDICPVTSLPAANVEGAVLDHIQRLLAAPELVARTWVTAKREDEITEREVTVLLPSSPRSGRAVPGRTGAHRRIVQLLVERST